jgi:hypothetical protein
LNRVGIKLAHGLDGSRNILVGGPKLLLGLRPSSRRTEQRAYLVVNALKENRKQQAVMDVGWIPEGGTETDPIEWEKARLAFWRLYWGSLSAVETLQSKTLGQIRRACPNRAGHCSETADAPTDGVC